MKEDVLCGDGRGERRFEENVKRMKKEKGAPEIASPFQNKSCSRPVALVRCGQDQLSGSRASQLVPNCRDAMPDSETPWRHWQASNEGNGDEMGMSWGYADSAAKSAVARLRERVAQGLFTKQPLLNYTSQGCWPGLVEKGEGGSGRGCICFLFSRLLGPGR